MALVAVTPTQVKTFLDRVLAHSGQNGVGRITKVAVAALLSVAASTLTNFLRNPFAGRVFTQFVHTFPEELPRIERALETLDVLVFLGRAERPQLEAQPPQAPIVISYRGHQSDKDGAGMLFDHMSLQRATRYPTTTLYPADLDARQRATAVFRRAIAQIPAALFHGEATAEGKKVPPVSQDASTGGLLIIPGRVHAIEHEPIRLQHEAQVIRQALNRGQPILGICAGAWRVWEAMLADVQPLPLPALVPVRDHNNGGGMLRLNTEGTRVVSNVQIHDVEVEADSHLHAAMRLEEGAQRLTANSVHWNAVNPLRTPAHVRLSAFAKRNPDLRRNTRQGAEMQPEKDSVEAFELRRGAPTMGIQWHPEGYEEGTPHHQLLLYMAQAGDAYAAKRKMLEELLT